MNPKRMYEYFKPLLYGTAPDSTTKHTGHGHIRTRSGTFTGSGRSKLFSPKSQSVTQTPRRGIRNNYGHHSWMTMTNNMYYTKQTI